MSDSGCKLTDACQLLIVYKLLLCPLQLLKRFCQLPVFFDQLLLYLFLLCNISCNSQNDLLMIQFENACADLWVSGLCF